MIPPTVPFAPVARSFVQFSHMTLVQGEDFEVFVDYTTTTIDEATFNSLPDVNAAQVNAHCSADWCGAEVNVASQSSSQGLATTGLVSATTNIVIYYDAGDQNDMARVRMKLCDRPADTALAICEPVTEVILPDGSAAAPVGTVDGLLQFFVPYTYSSTSVRSANFHTADLWISPPDSRS